MEERELLWAMLPDGLEPYFDFERYEKTEKYFRITLVEKNVLPKEMPEKYRNKRVVNTILKAGIFDDFPIRGLKGEIVLKRRMWKFEDVEEMLKRDIDICAPGTKIEKKFADFLKEFYRKFPDSPLPSRYVDEPESVHPAKTIQRKIK